VVYDVFALLVALSPSSMTCAMSSILLPLYSPLIPFLNSLPPMSKVMPKPPPPHVGFDVIAEMIWDVHLSFFPIPASAVRAVAEAGRKVKSSFTKSMGKRKVAESSLTSLTPATKRRATITPLASTSPGITRTSDAASHGRVMLINRDIVPPHCPYCTSVIHPVYKRLLTDDIVCLQAGDEIIVVIPLLDKGKLDDVARVHHAYYEAAFKNLMFYTLRRLNTGDWSSLVDHAIHESHTLI
jgi:hypothetical protein